MSWAVALPASGEPGSHTCPQGLARSPRVMAQRDSGPGAGRGGREGCGGSSGHRPPPQCQGRHHRAAGAGGNIQG